MGAGVVQPAWSGSSAPSALYLLLRFSIVGAPAYVRDPTWDLLTNPAVGASISARLPVFLALCWYYVQLLVYPHPLIAFNVPERLHTWGDWEPYAGLLLLVLAIAWIVRSGRRRPITVVLLWMIGNVLMVGQLVVPVGAYAEVRFAYTMLGAAGLAAGVLTARVAAERSAGVRAAAATAAAVLFAVFAAVVVSRNDDFRSQVSLLEADLKWRPTSAATMIRLGNAYAAAGDAVRADQYLEQATTRAPASSQAWYHRGTWYARQSRFDTALEFFDRASRLNPENYLALLNGSAAAMSLGRLDLARDLLARVDQVRPGLSKTDYNRAIVELRSGDVDAAVRRLEDLVRRDPAYADARRMLQTIRQAQAGR